MNGTHVFGYGSLVNARTHAMRGVEAARLSGFRRIWQPSPLRPVAYLTAVADAAGHILGATAEVEPGGWAALDERERAYRRHALPGEAIGREGVAVYSVERVEPPRTDQPILLSYLDVVIQGFLEVHGAEGTQDFFASTAGWETPVLNDRATPRYPRHQTLTGVQREAVDAGLASVDAVIIVPDPDGVWPVF